MNILTIVITTAISFLYVSHGACMNKEEKKLNNHIKSCQQIIAYNQEKLENYKNSALQQDHNKTILFIKDKFEKYAMELFQEQHNILNSIKQTYTIEPDAWDLCIKLIIDIAKFNKNNQHIPLPNIIHDASIPTDILTLITETLKCYNINPLRINIISEQTNEHYFYTLNIPGPRIDKGYQEIQFPPQSKPGRIIINLALFLQLSTVSQAALCMLMAEEIAQNAQLIPTIIAMKQDELVTLDNLFITESDAFKSLYSLCYDKSPSILLSIRSLETADCLLNLTTHNLLTDNGIPIHSEHDYKKLCKINRYWQILEWIDSQQRRT